MVVSQAMTLDARGESDDSRLQSGSRGKTHHLSFPLAPFIWGIMMISTYNDKHMSKPHGIDETVLTEHAFTSPSHCRRLAIAADNVRFSSFVIPQYSHPKQRHRLRENVLENQGNCIKQSACAYDSSSDGSLPSHLRLHQSAIWLARICCTILLTTASCKTSIRSRLSIWEP